MKIFRNASIKHKQVIIIMLTTCVALALACAAFTAYEVITFKKEMLRRLKTLGEVVGDNSAGAMDFNDPKGAEETLSALRAEPNIIGACIYLKSGEVFAKYDRASDGITFVAPPFRMDGQISGETELGLYDPVDYKGDVIGVVYIASDMKALNVRLEQYVLIGLGVFSVTLLVAFLVSAKLQEVVSEPILNLVQTTHAVAKDRNYSVRVTKESGDELGALVDGFNEMLSQIQRRDSELESARENLERRVEGRTEELRQENAERKRTEEELQLLSSALEQSKDAIIITDADIKRPGPRIVFVNAAFTRITGYEEAEAIGKSPRMLQGPKSDRASLNRLRQALELGEVFEGETVNYRKDGTTYHANLQVAPIRNSAGTITHYVGVQRDITERKKAAAELDAAQRQLVEISRQAGMAEVATSVLHNVGNVLNSVNISSAVVSEKVRSSRVASLGKVAALLQLEKGNLAAFFAPGGKGQLVPEFLSGLSVHLLDEQKEIISEMNQLASNIEHIKEIVSMQQSYARVSGMVEEHNPAELVEDALRMNAGAMERHQVRVIREFYPTSRVMVDKHKVLQILVNLIRNAKYALDEGKPDEKRMILCVAADGDKSVNISVIDNGVGIPKENLTRIFGHGFTTRKEGHGFGLHSGALAAKELGGSLKVHSAGPGKGATFTLELPVKGPVTQEHEQSN